MGSLASGVQRHFADSGPMNLRVRERMRARAGYGPPPATSRMGSLDAAATFEQGVRAYETLEFESARRFFARAAEQDPRSALAPAWLARISLLLRQNTAAGQAADQASRLVTPETSDIDRRYIAAVSAETRRDFVAAEDQYRELTERHRDEPGWFTELASFQDRRTETARAITTYREVLKLDGGLARPHLELCRLYNRLNEPASAKTEGDAALSAYRSLGDQSGEAQALMCLTDMLRLGNDAQRIEARRNAEAAVRIFEALGYGYNLARAQYYIALATEAQGQWADAAAAYEQSLASARLAGNVVLEPLDLMNLGAMNEILGSHSRAIDHYQQSQNLFQKLGDDQRAAQNQANIAAILIEYGGKPEEGLRNLQNALAVFRKLGDKNWEVFAAKVTAASYRSAGRHEDAERELNRAIALAKERNMDREIPALTIDLGLSRFEMSDYAGAETLLRRALGDGSGKSNASARIHLGLVHVRLGQFEAAGAEFDQAARDIQTRADTGFLPVLLSALGTLAYESGRRAEARTHFGKAAALWTDDLPDPASVEARASLGLLDALDGAPARARTAVQSSLEQAQKTGPFSLEARCRVYLARIEVGQHRADEALSVLNTITPEREEALGTELRAQVHYWRGQALSARGDSAGSRSEDSTARQLAQQLRASVPEPYRSSFSARPDIRMLIE